MLNSAFSGIGVIGRHLSAQRSINNYWQFKQDLSLQSNWKRQGGLIKVSANDVNITQSNFSDVCAEQGAAFNIITQAQTTLRFDKCRFE